MPSFIHLRVHSEYSIVDGIITIEALVEATVKYALPAVALTDQSNLFAAIKFYQAAQVAKLKPVLGVDLLLHHPSRPDKPFLLTLFCQNQKGYRALTQLVSRAYLEGQNLTPSSLPLIDKSWLENHTEGLIALSGGMDGDIGQALLNSREEDAEKLLAEWQILFPQRFYLEVSRIGRPEEEAYHEALLPLAIRHKAPLVATNSVRFLSADDFEAHEARVCIQEGFVLADPRRPKRYTAQQYLRSPEEMAEIFADMPAALENTVEIARRCNLMLQLGKPCLPKFPIETGDGVEIYMAKQARKMLAARLSAQNIINPDQIQQYEARLEFEIDVINSMGFAGYFLIVADFIQWAKNHDIPVGPGRGSGAGSLVAYALGITDIDPLPYDLLFERFLNPERVSMPDFDIDFCMDGRDRVIEYVAEKYGRESVSQIITYGSMAAKAVVRDVGRVLDHPYGFVDKIAKLIPFELGMTLEKALDQEAELLERYKKEEDVHALLDLAMKLEGLVRNAGKHAGGVVISPSRLTDFAPLYCEANGGNLVTQFDKDDVEAVGLVKFDFLGLRTLTIIHWALQNIQKAHPGIKLNINELKIDDQKVYELIKACATTAIFQLESRGMKDLIKRLQPDCFEEIIALVALFRPGPLQSGMVDDFIDRKHGRAKVEYPHPDIEPILRPTYGIILYQEQVMQIAQVLAGYTLGGADLLRRAMGKKKPEEMAKQREIFVEGAKARGVEARIASSIFDLMEKFAGYGFNKSHSAAYALVSYQTAWLKAHYPAEFMAAVLSSDMDNTDKIVNFIQECRQMDLKIIPPDINHSEYKFTVTPAGEILFGLGAIKGAGEAALNIILEERKARGKFKDLFDFCMRMGSRKVNKRVLESLIKSGAMDDFNLHRAALLANLDQALQFAEQQAALSARGQQDMFGSSDDRKESIALILAAEWPALQRLRGEKETLGIYHSGHPLEIYASELTQLASKNIADLVNMPAASVTIAGMVTHMRTMFTKRGSRMAFVTLEDRTGAIELTIFSEILEANKSEIIKDAVLIIEGDLAQDDFTGGQKLVARNVYSLNQIRASHAKSLILALKPEENAAEKILYLEKILKSGSATSAQNNGCPVWIHYAHPKTRARFRLGDAWRVSLGEELLQQLRSCLGEDSVLICY